MDDDKLTDKVEDSSVLQYVKATTTATERTRTIIIVMVVASVLVFTQARNEDGWLDRRIDVRAYALRLLDKNFDKDKELASIKDSEKRAHESEKYERAKYFINRYEYRADDDDRHRLRGDIEELVKLRAEHLRLIRLPFFGSVFDANDTGIFAGLTFTVVLLWLTLALNRERHNIQLAFREAEAQEKFRLCYDLLSMQQVLTVPPIARSSIWEPLGIVSKVLYVMPLVIYSYLFYQDFASQEIGNMLGWDKMTTLIRASKLFFALILCLTVACVVTSLKISADWIKYNKHAHLDKDASSSSQFQLQG